jgi:2-amino-4-hydroxy-6-hydroxymethyldihydropteridine diphosphokinase
LQQSESWGEPQPRLRTVILGLGSNLGDRVRYLERALEQLRRELRIERISSVYETQPVGLHTQPWFLNMVCLATTQMEPRALLDYVQAVQTALGRERGGERYAPRTLDIDILAYDDRVIEEPDLEIPHPRMVERAFVLEPLAEIAPEWRHPVEGKTAKELLEELSGELVRPYGDPLPVSGAAPL